MISDIAIVKAEKQERRTKNVKKIVNINKTQTETSFACGFNERTVEAFGSEWFSLGK